MKKSLYFALAASIVAFASCDDQDFTDWAAPTQIQNAQGNVDQVDGSVTPGSVIDFAELPDGATTVSLFNVSVSGCTLTSVKVKLQGTEYDSDANGTFAIADLESAIISAYGRAPELRTLQATVIGEAKTGNNIYAFSQPVEVKAILAAPAIESAYYLVGDMFGWDAESMVQFNHVGDGNVYDYPTFTLTFETTADGQYWKIIGQNGVDAGNIWSDQIGVEIDGDTSSEGYLSGANAGKIETAGKYKMTINMLEGTYSIEAVNYDEFIYYIGATDGWSNPDQLLKLQDDATGTYTGFIYCADPNGWGNEFKFQRVAGDWGTELNNSHFTTYEGAAADKGGNIGVTGGESVYYFEVSLGNMSIKATEITNMNLVGDFNGWNAADDAQQMTWNADERCYEITEAGVTSNGWKFTANNSWDINLGGVVSDLVANGDNLSVEGTTIKLYPTRTSKNTIYCTVE